ncbi:MAG TPA: hypothetical protein VNC11_16975 [Gemmatimonadaceae bacterium]|nr:hypothetical protein [Gemmatimonadaceae bacterium]
MADQIPLRVNRNLGMLLLAVWLILEGLVSLLNLSFSGIGVLLGLLALAAGVVLLLGK